MTLLGSGGVVAALSKVGAHLARAGSLVRRIERRRSFRAFWQAESAGDGGNRVCRSATSLGSFLFFQNPGVPRTFRVICAMLLRTVGALD